MSDEFSFDPIQEAAELEKAMADARIAATGVSELSELIRRRLELAARMVDRRPVPLILQQIRADQVYLAGLRIVADRLGDMLGEQHRSIEAFNKLTAKVNLQDSPAESTETP